MAYNRNHSHCAQDHNHSDNHGRDHEHDHTLDQPSNLGPQDNLYAHIDRDNVVALNSSQPGSCIIKPWHERLEETKFLDSDVDDQLILHIPFAGSVRLVSILFKTGPADQTPSRVLLFGNQPGLDFGDINDVKCDQEIEVSQTRDVVQYPVKPARFNKISSLTLFFPSAQGADSLRVYYVGLLGHWTEQRNDNPIIVYEAQANLADHKKIQGTEGKYDTPFT